MDIFLLSSFLVRFATPIFTAQLSNLSRNNGQCAEGHNYETQGAVCDCTTSILSIGSAPPYSFKRFVGKTCEIEVKSENYCLGNEHIFCVNNGVCKQMVHDSASHPCTCPPGFTGRHCEYAQEDVRSDCPLTCNNHGTCQHGIHDNQGGADKVLLSLENGRSTGFMHCACNNGYAGTQCDYEYTKCSAGPGRYCFHGSTCLNGTDICECENDNGNKRK